MSKLDTDHKVCRGRIRNKEVNKKKKCRLHVFILQQKLQTFSVGSKIKRSATTTQKATCEGKVDINGTEGHQHCCGQLDCDEVLLVAHQQPVRRRKSKKVFKKSTFPKQKHFRLFTQTGRES